MKNSDIYEILKPCATNDYQKRDGDYPDSDVPNAIYVSEFDIVCSFKNTLEEVAQHWLYKYLTSFGLELNEDSICTRQDGDYWNDWVVASWDFNKEKRYVK